MEYNIIYNDLIARCQHRPKQKNKGFELHHITPKSLGGDNTHDNLVNLTAKEHWVAHRLLHKIHTGKAQDKMATALVMMSGTKTYRVPSRFYEQIAQMNRQQARNSWQDPTYRARQLALRSDPERKARIVAKYKATMARKRAEGIEKKSPAPYKRRTIAEKIAKLEDKYKAKGIDENHPKWYKHKRYINSLKKQS